MSFPPFCDIWIQQVFHWVTYVIRSIGKVFCHLTIFFQGPPRGVNCQNRHITWSHASRHITLSHVSRYTIRFNVSRHTIWSHVSRHISWAMLSDTSLCPMFQDTPYGPMFQDTPYGSMFQDRSQASTNWIFRLGTESWLQNVPEKRLKLEIHRHWVIIQLPGLVLEINLPNPINFQIVPCWLFKGAHLCIETVT